MTDPDPGDVDDDDIADEPIIVGDDPLRVAHENRVIEYMNRIRQGKRIFEPGRLPRNWKRSY